MDTADVASPVPVPLESILCTEELQQRPPRPPDHQAEIRALSTLAQALADSPRTILQTLADTILEVFGSESSGVSLVTEDEKRFHWPAIAGTWKPHIGGGTPRDFGPCGDVIDLNSPLLFKHFERRYTYFLPVTPLINECLLVPFYVEGRAVGTIWAVTHDPNARKFDNEDLRMLTSMGVFASSAYQAVESLDRLERQAEELRGADHRKNEFLALLAHELRNPLAPISNALQIIQRTETLDESVRSASEMMHRQVHQMTRLVDDLLDVSRIIRGTIQLRTGVIDLATTISQAAEATRSLSNSLGHELTVGLPSQAIYVNGDANRLVQVVGNLLSNACKFTEPGGRIHVTVEREGEQAVIQVKDSGIGIAEDALPRVFDAYMQVDTSIERAQTGLGIGLMLVKNVVEMHEGTVEVRSAGLGQGSEFVVRLPIVDALHPPSKPTVREPVPLTKRRRILIVDDYRDSADSLAMLLKADGHEIQTAYDGLEAFEAAATFRPEVILMDIGLPKLSGYEVARKIREQRWGENVLLVALTGWAQDEDRHKSKAVGFDSHMTKPVNHAALTELLAE